MCCLVWVFGRRGKNAHGQANIREARAQISRVKCAVSDDRRCDNLMEETLDSSSTMYAPGTMLSPDVASWLYLVSDEIRATDERLTTLCETPEMLLLLNPAAVACETRAAAKTSFGRSRLPIIVTEASCKMYEQERATWFPRICHHVSLCLNYINISS